MQMSYSKIKLQKKKVAHFNMYKQKKKKTEEFKQIMD